MLISGILTLFQSNEEQTLEDLLRAINGIKTILSKTKPLIVLTAPLIVLTTPLNDYESKIFSHLRSVLVMINEDIRYTEYVLVQHPYLPENRLLKWKTRDSKRKSNAFTKNTTLDSWLS